MIYFLEEINTFNDTWKMTFYFVFAVVILLGILWTVLQMSKKEKKTNLKENIIYNKSYDAIENVDVLPKRKHDDKLKMENHYDVYQNENKIQMDESVQDEESREEDIIKLDGDNATDSLEINNYITENIDDQKVDLNLNYQDDNQNYSSNTKSKNKSNKKKSTYNKKKNKKASN